MFSRYRGPKVLLTQHREVNKIGRKVPHRSGIKIGTAFDNPKKNDPPPPVLRHSEPTTLSYLSSHIRFEKAADK